MKNSGLNGVFSVLYEYFSQNIEARGSRPNGIFFDDVLGREASDCCKLQVAGFLAMCEQLGLGKDPKMLGDLLVADVHSRASTPDWFAIPYSVPLGEVGQVDIAEVGASIDALYWASGNMATTQQKGLFSQLGLDMMERVAPQCQGAFFKNPLARERDILNGDVYGALVLTRAFQVTKSPEFRDQVVRTVHHLLDRFDAHHTDGWAYSEMWDGSVAVGYSVAYQATITGWGAALIEIIDEPLAARWEAALTTATERLHADLQCGPSESTEAPSWSRGWDGIWEIYLALSRWEHENRFSEYLSEREAHVVHGVGQLGMSYFDDFRPTATGRTPTGSTLRKAANFGAIMTTLYFDNIEPRPKVTAQERTG